MVQIKRLNSTDNNFNQALQQLLAFDTIMDESIDATVAKILTDIKTRGNAALIEYTRQFDHVHASSIEALELTRDALHQSLSSLPNEQRQALELAAKRIRTYHEKQTASSWHYQEDDSTMLGQKVTPLDRVGLYVPGGKASYPSSVLMNAIPAKVAGVKELYMVVPTPHGEKNDMVLAAAAISEVDRVFTIGGAQAIGALAYGTETIPQVDKIVGPGNAYVAAAKRRVFGIVGIDMVAGPSEILVICDGKTHPDWIAMDMFSQAEHDELAQSILLTPNADYLNQVAQSIDQLIDTMPRQNVIRAALENRGALIQVQNLEEACAIANTISPEHLELSVDSPELWVDKIRHAGAIFMGRHTCEALGDYCAGPNHVLPTSRTARFSSPLGVYDFQKRSSLIQVSQQGAAKLGEVASVLAYSEGLQAHARSAEYRIKA
ncbi:MAG: histidinol dehydrogenase [Burkholderiales bacterium]|uniref:histidinol dehydrogenase n=1 Tax=Nitrosomonas sp. TaxID=42353 RepID=UPI001DE64E3E|nr:histidinol dehydrogenase [Nitrosomonas sp.]MCB1948964.1 histidinol dehydrogenase [Nitrosomonas sp.]MCP5243967.1 histidinol dehydrogenase [Burkholderiales bacterium]